MNVKAMATKARKASGKLASMSTADKNHALAEMAHSLIRSSRDILEANGRDLELAEISGLPEPMLKRLALNEAKLRSMADGMIAVGELQDPVNRVLETFERPNGLVISRISVPFGVVGVVYESRPNVTADAAAICLKSGNTVILRGGKESAKSNIAITKALRKGLARAKIPEDCIQYLRDDDRSGFNEMIHLRGYIDLIVPRGGAGLIRTVIENSTVPSIETGTGNCHLYVHQDADLDSALSIIVNAKCSNPSVCNAIETVLVHRQIAPALLPRLCQLLHKRRVEIRACENARRIAPNLLLAQDTDWDEEYLSLILAVRIVDGLEDAIGHISEHGTRHSESILTKDSRAADRFVKAVDAACVYVNASTRFTDGEEFGFGAEIGISTQKLHARGPMGLRELTTHKYVVTGQGHVR